MKVFLGISQWLLLGFFVQKVLEENLNFSYQKVRNQKNKGTKYSIFKTKVILLFLIFYLLVPRIKLCLQWFLDIKSKKQPLWYSSKISEMMEYQESLEGEAPDFRDTSIKFFPTKTYYYSYIQLGLELHGPNLRYSSPLQLRYPQLRFFHNYTILYWVQKNSSYATMDFATGASQGRTVSRFIEMPFCQQIC